MFKKYQVITRTINLSDGESLTNVPKDTEKEAFDLYYDNLSKFGGNEQVKAVVVMVYDTKNNLIKYDERDNSKYITAPIEE